MPIAQPDRTKGSITDDLERSVGAGRTCVWRLLGEVLWLGKDDLLLWASPTTSSPSWTVTEGMPRTLTGSLCWVGVRCDGCCCWDDWACEGPFGMLFCGEGALWM